MSRTLKVTGNYVMYDHGAWFLRVIMSSSRALCYLPSVKKQKLDFQICFVDRGRHRKNSWRQGLTNTKRSTKVAKELFADYVKEKKLREPEEKKELAQTLKTCYVEARKKGFVQCIIKQLLDSVFVISRIIKVSVRVISLSRTPTSTLIILDITKTSSNKCLQSETPAKEKIWYPVVLFWKLLEKWRNYKTFRLALRTMQIRTDSLFTDTLLWMQSNNDCSKKKNKQDRVHLQVTLKLLTKTNDTILYR